jgi:hypothetical protein
VLPPTAQPFLKMKLSVRFEVMQTFDDGHYYLFTSSARGFPGGVAQLQQATTTWSVT